MVMKNYKILRMNMKVDLKMRSINLNRQIIMLALNLIMQSHKLNLKIHPLKLKPLTLSFSLNSQTPSLNPLWQLQSLNWQTLRYLQWLTTSWIIQNARLKISRKNTCVNFSATRGSLLTCSIEGQNMDGSYKTSTIDVTTRGLPSPCLRSKTETSSVAIPKLSGNLLLLTMLVIVMRCCSTCLANVTSPTNEQEMRYSATQ